MAGQLDAVHTRHADVAKHDVRHIRGQPLQRLQAITGFTRHTNRELPQQVAQQGAKALTGQRLVVDNQYFQGFGHGKSIRTS